MQTKFKRNIVTILLSITLSACIGSQNQPNNSQPQESSSKQAQTPQANVAEFTAPEVVSQKANYKKATRLNAELAIIYSTNDYLDLAKGKLVKAQQLSQEHGYELAIVDYAAGYYYQTVGADSIAEKYYKEAISNHPKNFEAMNFYAQYLCQRKEDYNSAQELFDKSLFMSDNNDMAQTLFLYSECMYKQGKKDDALKLMLRADRFSRNYRAAKLRLAEMYYERKDYKNCYRIIYGMKDDETFFNNKRILELRLKLAEYAHNKNEAAEVRLIMSSNNYNDEDINKFFSKAEEKDIEENGKV